MTFFDEMATKLQAGGDFAYAYVVAHEVGHHVQNRLGISDRVTEMRQRVSEVEGNQLSVRLELQADCFAGMFGNYTKAQGIIEPGDFRGRPARRFRDRRRPTAAQFRAHGHSRFVHPRHVGAAPAVAGPRHREGLLRSLRHLQGRRPLTGYAHPVPPEFAARAVVKAADYQAAYEESIRDPAGFWAKVAERIDWYRFPTRIKDVSFHPEDFRIRWYEDGELNVSVNCLDRQLAKRGDKTALLFEGDDPAVARRVSYRELHEAVCRFGNALRRLGVKKGDRITIYMPMIPEAAVAMLACARIGAVHSVVFGGFSPESLAGRIADCASTLVITADEGVRGGRKVPLKANVDAAIASHRLDVKNVRRREAHGRGRRLGRRARRALRGHHGRGSSGLRAGADERRGSALHPLYVRLDGKAEGRAAHERRLPGVRELHLRRRLRLPRGRRLLVHRRRRLGHRAQLHRLRAAVERRDQPDVRGRAELPRHVALLARRGQAPGHDLLHRARRRSAR